MVLRKVRLNRRRQAPKRLAGQTPSALALTWDAWRMTRGTPEAIAARRQERLADLLAYARAHSRFYAERYRDVPTRVTEIDQLPPVTKAELMDHFDAWVTDPAITRPALEEIVADPARVGEPALGRYLVWTTSGSTGRRAILLQDRRTLAVYSALTTARLALPALGVAYLWNVARHGRRQAMLLATGGHFGGVSLLAYLHRTQPWTRRFLRLFPVQTPLPELVAALNAFDPAFVSGYATALAVLADEQRAGRLHLAPTRVMSSSETLVPAERAKITAAFGATVSDTYASSEAPFIAQECCRGRLHVNADWVILEAVDADYQPIPPGEPSWTVLVTNLANRVQPIIRYDLGDCITVLPDPCPCGSTLPVVRVEGRTDEILTYPTPAGQTTPVLPLALATAIEETPGVAQFQAIQTAPTELTIRLAVHPGADAARTWEAVEARLHAFFAGQGTVPITLRHAPEPPARDLRSGKFRHIWSASRSTA